MGIARIMIVEDEAIIAMDIKRRVLSLGYDVIATASAANECISKLETVKPDLILMDIILKGQMDGIEAAQIIKAKFGIPIIYLTAHADEKTLHRAKITQPYGYILKPFEIRDLQTTIEIALYKHAMEAKLAESELKYRTLVKTATDAVLILDEYGEIISFNSTVNSMFGYEEDEINGSNIKKLLPDVFINHMVDGIKRFLSVGKPITSHILELHARKKTGAMFPVEISFSQWRVDEKALYSTLIIRDITHRKEIEEALRKAHNEMEERVEERTIEIKALTDQSPFPIGIYSLKGEVTYVNKAWERLWNSKLSSLQQSGYNIFEDKILSHFGYQEEIRKIFKQGGSLRTKPLFIDPYEFPYLLDSEGIVLIVDIYALLNDKGKVFRVVSFLEDITERIKAEEVNLELEAKKKSSAMLLNNLEEERSRISRDLHDSVGQMLSAVKFNIEVYEKSSKVENKQLQEARRLLAATSQELKNIIHSLHPISIDHYGMIAAIELLIKEFSESNSSSLKFSANGLESRLNRKIELNVFRIVQEALNNIAKHSNAQQAEIILSLENNILSVFIRDNGKGFIFKNLNEYSKVSPSYGIINMKERVEMLNGSFLVVSSPGKGTEINIEIPIN
ncbi:MAG: PAS domain S-box protein [Bacteroidota bacterium]|nr:PAS domain S-box protein [Bacteroidota bacterium]